MSIANHSCPYCGHQKTQEVDSSKRNPNQTLWECVSCKKFFLAGVKGRVYALLDPQDKYSSPRI